MGFFSWRTCDTGESVAAPYAEHPRAGDRVYLLQPGEREPISGVYDGYGRVGGEDVSVWLARMNAREYGVDLPLDEDEQERLGAAIDEGSYYYDIVTGQRWAFISTMSELVGARLFPGKYDDVIDELGRTPNQLIESGRWTEHELEPPTYPLKLSFDPNAVYEDWPASPPCPYQGFFYPSDDDRPGPGL